MQEDLCFLTISEAARLISRKCLSPVELTEALISRIERFDGTINAFVERTFDAALEAASNTEREIMSSGSRGPLHGIPFGLKDIFNSKNIRTAGGSRLCLDNIPHENATSAQRLIDAGAILLGKLATHEFACGGPSLDLPWPPARNPWSLSHFTGGSSTGSAAAVAAGFIPASLGTDTGGSIRGPASFCGVVGLKPTYGLVSRHGVMPNSYSFDHVGPIARTVEDCAILLQSIAGYDPHDPTSVMRSLPDYRAALISNMRGLRIGILRHFWEDDPKTHPDAMRAMAEAIRVFQDLGATISDARMRPRQDYHDVIMIISKTEITTTYKKYLCSQPELFGDDFLVRNIPGLIFTETDYVRAQQKQRLLIDEMASLYRDFDVLVTMAAGPAPLLTDALGGGASSRWLTPSIYNPFNVIGAPALSICCGRSETGLPIGMQIIGRPFDETTILRAAHAYEVAAGWSDVHPALKVDAKPLEVQVTASNSNEGAGDDDSRAFLEATLARAKITLSEQRIASISKMVPAARAIADRIRSEQLG